MRNVFQRNERSLRENVTIGQTFGGNSWKINFAHISKLIRVLIANKSQHTSFGWISFFFSRKSIITKFNLVIIILRFKSGILAEVQPKYRFWTAKSYTNLGASHHELKNPGPIKSNRSWKKHTLLAVWAILDHLYTQSNWIYPTYF